MKNKATTETVTVPVAGNNDLAEAGRIVNQVGMSMKQPGYEHMGYVCIHFYKNMFSTAETYQVQIQKSLSSVEEGFADYGIKEAAKAMMAAYGRKVPTHRK
jgi:hypothetical protein